MRSINLRESSASEAAAVARDPIQRVLEVMNTKTILEKGQTTKLSIEKLANYYQAHIRFASTSEPVSKSFLESAFPVWSYILRGNGNLEALRQATVLWGKNTPFNSVYKLYAIVAKCERKTDLISWNIHAIIDLCR